MYSNSNFLGDLQSKIEESSSTEALITGEEAENNPETAELRNLNLNLNLDQDMSRTRDPTKTDEIGLEENWFKNLNLEQIKVETGDWNSDSEFGDSISTCSSSNSGYTRGKDGSRREDGSNHSSSESQLWDKVYLPLPIPAWMTIRNKFKYKLESIQRVKEFKK